MIVYMFQVIVKNTVYDMLLAVHILKMTFEGLSFSRRASYLVEQHMQMLGISVRPPQHISFSGSIDDLEGLFEFTVIEDAKDVLAWSVDVFAQ